MDDSTYAFTVVLIIAGFVLIFLISWLDKKINQEPSALKRTNRLLEELKRHADEQDRDR